VCRLAASVPAPRFNAERYGGVLGSFVARIAYTTEFNNRRVSRIKLNAKGATPPAEPAEEIARSGSTGIAFARVPD
jgi:hypothetical protein